MRNGDQQSSGSFCTDQDKNQIEGSTLSLLCLSFLVNTHYNIQLNYCTKSNTSVWVICSSSLYMHMMVTCHLSFWHEQWSTCDCHCTFHQCWLHSSSLLSLFSQLTIRMEILLAGHSMTECGSLIAWGEDAWLNEYEYKFLYNFNESLLCGKTSKHQSQTWEALKLSVLPWLLQRLRALLPYWKTSTYKQHYGLCILKRNRDYCCHRRVQDKTHNMGSRTLCISQCRAFPQYKVQSDWHVSIKKSYKNKKKW